MADKDLGRDDGPSLELPSFSLRRKRKKKAEESPAPRRSEAPAAEPDVARESESTAEPEPVREPAVAPEPAHAPEPAREPEPPRAPEPAPEPPREPEPEPEPATRQQPAVAAPADPEPATRPQPAVDPEPAPVATGADADDTAVLPHDKPSDRPRRTGPAPRRRSARAPVRLPAVAGPIAAALTGLVVGLLLVALSWGSQQGCAAIRGTTSCGGPGFFLLLAILVVLTVLGGYLLRAWGVRDSGSTSFLAMGLLTVVVLLFLIGSLFEWWMVIVVPLVAVATYLTSHWVTTRVADDA